MACIAEIEKLISMNSKHSKGPPAFEIMTDETVDISEYFDFQMYNWITYKKNSRVGEAKLGQWLRVSRKVSSLISYWILTKS